MTERCCVLIPAYCPSDQLVLYVEELCNSGIRDILVVNDGSGRSFEGIFDQLKQNPACEVIGYRGNRGKGAALKYGFEHILRTRSGRDVIVTADSDGQHRPEDVLRVMQASLSHPEAMVLGERDFTVTADGKTVPIRSRFGNACSSGLFFLLFHRRLRDTQTGLRGIPFCFLPWMCEISGERYEYETQVLLACVRKNIPFLEVSIQTVYENNNAGSHFDPLRDSLRIMGVMFLEFFMFMGSSLLSAAVDIICAWILLDLFRLLIPEHDLIRITAATIGARLVSMWVNYTLNRKLVFRSGAGSSRTLYRYVALCMIVMALSALFVYFTSCFLGWNEKTAKVVGDCLLFFLSYRVQKEWVFRT